MIEFLMKKMVMMMMMMTQVIIRMLEMVRINGDAYLK